MRVAARLCALDGARGDADDALERAREGGFGAVAEPARELADRGAVLAQLVEREVHAPAREVGHRGLADEVGEPCCERRA